MTYAQDIKIDDQLLDVEWCEQPEKMVKYCSIMAEAEKTMDLAKEKLEAVKAEIDKDVRSNPAKYGLDKITDKVAENTVVLQDQYKEASTAYINAKYEFKMAQGAVKAFEQRKDALENLVKLHGQSYFAGPRVPHDLAQLRGKKSAEFKIERTH
jgi:hypothetical protein